MSRSLRAFVSEAYGLDAESLGRGALERAAEGRMRALGLSNLDAYSARLAVDAAERAALAELVVVPETWFFRDTEPFNCLAEHMRTAARAQPGKRLRVLSAPCATGEEPYSAAIALLRAGIPGEAFEVHAVDLSAVALERARKGEYGASSFRGVSPVELAPWVISGPRGIRPHPDAASRVRFHQANLCDPGLRVGEGPFDAVLCRNLLIYLTPEARQCVLSSLDRLLLPGGLLLTGHSEIMLLAPLGYENVRHPRAFARRKPVAPAAPTITGKAASGAEIRHAMPEAQASWPTPCPSQRRAVWSKTSGEGKAPQISSDPPPGPRMEPEGELLPDTAGNKIQRPPADLDLAKRLADEGRLNEADDICREALAARPHDAEAHALQGRLAAARGVYAEAEAAFARALYLCPTHREALTHLALAAERRGDASRAEILRARLKRAGRAATEEAS